jgi:peptide deformylase
MNDEVKGRVLEFVPPDDPLLYQETREFDFTDPPVDPNQLALDLVTTLWEKNALGVSANQVGLPWRVFVMRAEVPYVCFNPRIVHRSDEEQELEEACLSYPGLIYKARRPRSIRVRFQTPSGNISSMTFNGMSARVFEHEMDHMHGRPPFTGIGRLKIDSAVRKARKAYGRDYSDLHLLRFA